MREKISETADQAGIATPSMQEVQEAGHQANQNGSEQDALMSLSSKVMSPSSLAALESL